MHAFRGASRYLRAGFLALVLFLLEARCGSSACPAPCVCHVPTEVHCTFRSLSMMPSGVQHDVKRINLGYNSLTILKEHELSGLKSLELLMLHSNTIQTIEDRAFSDLKALQVLKMSYNRVKELRKDTFQGLENLLRLYMNHNAIEFIHPEAFYGLTLLQLVNLEGNILQQLHPDTFITLRYNQIFKFSSIKTIYLSENALTTLPATVFTGCYQLENLFLNGNPWSCDCRMDWLAAWIERNPGSGNAVFEGNPEPAISWKRFSLYTGTTLTIEGKMGKFEVFGNGTLLIQNANVKDRGQYICLAENAYGSDKLTVMLSVVAYPSRILEAKVRDIKAHSGETVEMKCKTEGRPVPVVSWILANRTQVRGQNNGHGRVTVTREGTLVIQQVSVYDRGHYKCIASNPAGIDTATVRLQVVAAPPGILEEKRQLVKADVGQSVWMPCTAQGDPQPTTHWVLMDGTVVMPHHTSSRVNSFPNGTLHLKNLGVSDSGKYECIATSSTGSERRVVTLSVEKIEIAPQIIETSGRRTELAYGSQLRLNCTATGIPKPQIIWRLPSKALVDRWHRMGSRIQVLENGTIVIDSVSDKDAGDYLCVARSSAGDDLQLMKVSVSMKPAKIEPKFGGKKQVPYGKELKVDCKASGAPVPEISWGLPDGTLVNNALQADGGIRSRSKRYILFDNGTLYLNKVGMDEEGDYTCYAENTLGKDEMHVHITVVSAAPRIRPSPLNYAKVKPGGNIRFDCEAIGEPKPKILWMLPSSDMIAASNERYLMHVNGSLDIRNVKLADAGEYVCIARNAAGDESKVYKLEMDGNPPIINGYYKNRTVVKDTAEKYSRKFIDCKAEGDPPPKITWIMPDNIFLTAPYYGSRIFVHYNGTLEIRNVRPTDTAEFICMARNDGGEAVLVIHLEVTNQLMRPIFKNPFNERLVTQLGKTTVLNCSADGNPPPDMIWSLPNGTQLIGGHNVGSQHHVGSDGTFVIHNPSKGDAGKYRCAAKNKVGYIEKLIILDVGQKPYILTRPRGIIRSVYGEPLFIHCLADGSPRPSIFWTVPGGHVISRTQITGRYQLMDNGTLVIRQTNLNDRGNYMCRAKNNVGDALLTVPVIILAYIPRITNGPPPNIRMTTGTPVQLTRALLLGYQNQKSPGNCLTDRFSLQPERDVLQAVSYFILQAHL
ncbi:hypothetical protein QTP70_026032 [Hemibagrus guttatus]|uniref:Ig-like domain-containing protein n=1 Tax=Hemibagrus guttatus TaxID=175788 RepID=A0AAE0Q3X7_9TELE|nr:hypothetical protein QTP70_026032 [Hemibagrus guttatus]